MKRIHTPEAKRYAHHERATIARRLARAIKRATKPARLKLLALDAMRSDAYYVLLFFVSEGLRVLMRREHYHRERISARRQEVEGEPA